MIVLDFAYRTGLVVVLAFVFLTTPMQANSLERLTRPINTQTELVPRLRASVEVESYYVTIGDLFDHAGVLAEVAIFRAPDLGQNGRVRAETVADAARRAGMTRMDLDNIISVMVERRSHRIIEDDIKDLVIEAIRQDGNQLVERDITVTLDEFPSVLHADPTASEPLQVSRFRHNRRNGRFDVALIVDQGEGEKRFTVRGRAVETVEVATLIRPLGRGDIVQDGDIALQRVPFRQALRLDVIDIAALIGKAAKRPLRAGAQISAGDFTLPIVVQRNGIVSIQFKTKGLTLSARGRALSEGAIGDTVTVLNAQSKRTLQAIVEAPGLVIVGGGIGQIASLGGQIQ